MKMTKTKYLNLFFDDLNIIEAIGKIEKYIASGSPHTIFTLGAELVVRAQKDELLRKIYNSADVLTVDSSVVFYSALISGFRFKEPISAVRLVMHFIEKNANKGYRYYLLGAREEVLNEAISNLKKKYPNILIVGSHHGYFDINNADEIVNDISSSKPDILLVAMSSPLKEKFIYNNLNRMNVPVSIAVGGAIDIIAGKYKLAPGWISALGLEWFYRFIQEPFRLWKRYLITNTAFVWLVIKNISWRAK